MVFRIFVEKREGLDNEARTLLNDAVIPDMGHAYAVRSILDDKQCKSRTLDVCRIFANNTIGIDLIAKPLHVDVIDHVKQRQADVIAVVFI